MEGEKKKILVVDDDDFLLDLCSRKFSQAGFEVFTALGADIALHRMGEGWNPDVILLDVVMPGLNGFEFLKKIHDENRAPKAITIMLSNRGQESDIQEAKRLGAVGYIIKANSTPGEVVTRVAEILKVHTE